MIGDAASISAPSAAIAARSTRAGAPCRTCRRFEPSASR
jgi:hypothetical protein